ncbi:MAG: M12 family metallo-peptidase [Bacteriovoracales bacterium]|nr:M12 family metallo-peptidase [Bacteriovoracales bacterium]
MGKSSFISFYFLIFLIIWGCSTSPERHIAQDEDAIDPDREARSDIPLCEGGVGRDDRPMGVEEASTAGEPVALKEASQDKIHVIDIAFIYAGSISNKAKLRKNVEAAVLKANVIFQRSGVNARLRTVALEPDHRYNIALNGMDLEEAALEVETALPQVRKDYGADLLYALTGGESSYCGLAFIRERGHSRRYAANYLSVGAIWNGRNHNGCLGDHSALAHEVGHNLGLVHNREDSSLSPFVSYGRGYKGKNIRKRFYSTVMDISSRDHQFSRFSTNASHDGLRMGTSEENASKALLYTIEDASNYASTKVRDPEEKYRCLEDATSVCLQSGRFKVRASVSYVKSSGQRVNHQKAKVREAMLNGVNKTTSLFYFFGRDNPELLVKVINGCGVNGKYWVFGSAGTDLNYRVTVTDNATGVRLPYHRNARNSLINDTGAFPCHP